MPISYSIDASRGVVLTTASGALTDPELLEHKRTLTRDQQFRPGMVELSDVRGVERLDVTAEGVRQFVAQDAQDSDRLSGYRLAIVASQDLVFGMARMYEILTEKNALRVRIFRDMDEARVWLGL